MVSATMKAPTLFRYVATCVLAVLPLVPTALGGPDHGAGHLEFPAVRLDQPERGSFAVDQLGTALPQVARCYGLTAAELHRRFLTDASLAVDQTGRLHYAEPVPQAVEMPLATGGEAPVIAPEQTFQLHSRPGAKRTIFLDFDGHVLSGTGWNLNYNGGADIVAPPFDLDGDPGTFNAAEQAVVQEVWLRVAEDFAPFDVDVTTEFPGEDRLSRPIWSDDVFGTRILISPISSYFGSYGGLAYLGTFDDIGDLYKTALVFPERLSGRAKFIAEAAAHECGHALGLNHDGVTGGSSYYGGHGTGETYWAPLMGVGYYASLTQWSRGEYPGANNAEDDFTVVATYGLARRGDDHGNTASAATAIAEAGSWTRTGIIGQADDVDAFQFTATDGTWLISANPAAVGANLDLVLEVRSADGTVVAVADPAETVAASLSADLAGGTYVVLVRGTGLGDPLADGYSDYGSLGNYRVAAVPDTLGRQDELTPLPPVAGATFSATEGEAGITLFSFDAAASHDTDGAVVGYAWDFGDGTTASGAQVTKVYSSPGAYQVILTVTDDSGLTGSCAGTITVVAPNVPPVAVAGVSAVTATAPATLTFDGSLSADSDGSLVAHVWTFSDGGTALGSVVSRAFAEAGTYSAVLTVTDDRGAATSATVLFSVTEVKSTRLRVESIGLAQVKSGTKSLGKANVLVTDTAGKPVVGAKVSFRWSGVVSGTGSALTDATGTMVTTSKTFSNAGTLTFTVTGLGKSGYTYTSADNAVTTVSIAAGGTGR